MASLDVTIPAYFGVTVFDFFFSFGMQGSEGVNGVSRRMCASADCSFDVILRPIRSAVHRASLFGVGIDEGSGSMGESVVGGLG